KELKWLAFQYFNPGWQWAARRLFGRIQAPALVNSGVDLRIELPACLNLGGRRISLDRPPDWVGVVLSDGVGRSLVEKREHQCEPGRSKREPFKEKHFPDLLFTSGSRVLFACRRHSEENRLEYLPGLVVLEERHDRKFSGVDQVTLLFELADIKIGLAPNTRI